MKVINEKHNVVINIYQEPSIIEKCVPNILGVPINILVQDDKFIYSYESYDANGTNIRQIEPNEIVQHDNFVRDVEILIPIKNKFIKHRFTKDFIIDLYNQIKEIESEKPMKPFINVPF